MGVQLGNLISDTIDNMVTDENSRGDIIEDVAQAGGIAPDTLREIINGEIDCPPLDRLQGFASALDGVSASDLESAGNSDGCSYDAEKRKKLNLINS